MEIDKVKILDIEDLSALSKGKETSIHAHDYLFRHVTPANLLAGTAEDLRVMFDGLCFFLCNDGIISLKVNFKIYELKPMTLFAVRPDDVLDGIIVDKGADFDFYVLCLSRSFLRDLNFNLNVFRSWDMIRGQGQIITLGEADNENISHYIKLLDYNARARKEDDDDVYTKNIARNISAALFYYLMSLRHKMQDDFKAYPEKTSRKTALMLEFMGILRRDYKKERNLKYYAEQLCITPKYLSTIVRETTQKSATAWIDECVVQEAKNLLRYSGMNVQQVSYELNFPNQSTFGKYFKNLTGMTPSQFQNT